MRARNNKLVSPGDGSLKMGTTRWKRGGHFLNAGDGETWFGRKGIPKKDTNPVAPVSPVHDPREVLFGGNMQTHFGHFICESISRLWALDRLGPDIPIAYGFDQSYPEDLNGTPRSFFDLVGVYNPIILVQRPMVFAKVWNASCLYHPMLMKPMHPRLRNWILGRLPEPKEVTGPDIYVTRSGLAGRHGRILGESFLEQGLRSVGYDIFRPEEHSLEDQINAYRNARRIILSESSSVHLMSIVVRARAKVAMIMRRASLLRGMDGAKESFLSKNVYLASAFRGVWYQERADDWGSLFGVAELDFAYLWAYLQNRGFIADARSMPVPLAGDLEAERREVAPDRVLYYALEPGFRYRYFDSSARPQQP